MNNWHMNEKNISNYYICEKKGGGGKEGCSKEPSH